MIRKAFPCILFLLTVTATTSCQAESAEKHCRYVKYGELPITFAGLTPTIEGAINGKPMKMLVDTGADGSFLFSPAVKKLNLRTRSTDDFNYGVGGIAWQQVAKVDKI